MRIAKFYQDFQDPIQLGQQGDRFSFWYGLVPLEQIYPDYTLDDLCQQANNEIAWLSTGVFEYTDHRRATFDLAQFVKINLLYHSLICHDNIKPWLLYRSNTGYRTRTGDTRRRAMELLGQDRQIPALICSPAAEILPFKAISCFEDFAQACGVAPGTSFWFDVAAADLDYGIEWYEVALDNHTGIVGQRFRDFAIDTIRQYMRQQPQSFRFTREWFTRNHDWPDP